MMRKKGLPDAVPLTEGDTKLTRVKHIPERPDPPSESDGLVCGGCLFSRIEDTGGFPIEVCRNKRSSSYGVEPQIRCTCWYMTEEKYSKHFHMFENSMLPTDLVMIVAHPDILKKLEPLKALINKVLGEI